MSKQTLITSRDDKGRHAVGLFEVAYNKAMLDEARAQRLNERGGELQNGITRLITELTMLGRFADEEVESSYGYMSGYKPNPTIEENLRNLELELHVLRSSFPEFANSDYDRQFVERIGLGGVKLPEGAERWTLILKWETLAPTYGEAVKKVLAMIGFKWKFYNYRDGQLGANSLRQHACTAKMFQTLGDQQKDHDILVVPAQFGLRHGGRSVRRAREVMNANEFGLGAFAVGIMILTHPERLQHLNDLWIDCAGDEFAPYADGGFLGAPHFCFDGDRVEFGADFIGHAVEGYGSSSAFLP